MPTVYFFLICTNIFDIFGKLKTSLKDPPELITKEVIGNMTYAQEVIGGGMKKPPGHKSGIVNDGLTAMNILQKNSKPKCKLKPKVSK